MQPDIHCATFQHFLTAETSQLLSNQKNQEWLFHWSLGKILPLHFSVSSMFLSFIPESQADGQAVVSQVLALSQAQSPVAYPRNMGNMVTFLYESRTGLRGESGLTQQPVMHHSMGFSWLQTQQWKFDKPQAPEIRTVRLKPFTTNSCFPTSTVFPCFIYFNQGLHNAQITQKNITAVKWYARKPTLLV